MFDIDLNSETIEEEILEKQKSRTKELLELKRQLNYY